MGFQIRPITPDEFPAFHRAEGVGFANHPTESECEAQRPLFEFDRSLAVFDGAAIVGTAGVCSYTLTLPGLTTLPVAGIVYVSALPTYRRQGLLRGLMDRQLDDIRARGEAVAILNASESAIYGRFGYGMATFQMGFGIERVRAAFAQSPRFTGKLALVDAAEAADLCPGLYDTARAMQPGAIGRGAEWWRLYFRDMPEWRGDDGPRFTLIYRAASGAPEGYASYRVKQDWRDGLQNHTLRIGDLFALSVEARLALWHYLLNLDLIQTVSAGNRPVDEPLRWLLADPRRLRLSHLTDGLWVRLIDISAALAARRYAVSSALVFEVHDSFRPHNTGCYRLEGDPAGADCRPTDAAPDLSLNVEDLGATYLGGVRFGTLARAGRVVEHTAGALALADALFACEPAPWGTTPF